MSFISRVKLWFISFWQASDLGLLLEFYFEQLERVDSWVTLLLFFLFSPYPRNLYYNYSLFSIISVLCLLSIFLQPFQILYSPLLSCNLYLSLPTTLSTFIFLLNLHSFLFFRLFCIYTCFYFYRSYESFHSISLSCTLFSYSSVRF